MLNAGDKVRFKATGEEDTVVAISISLATGEPQVLLSKLTTPVSWRAIADNLVVL